MAKSVQNYIDELYSQGKTEADRLKEQRTQADDKLIQQTNAAIDKAAAASAKPYQTQLDELPALYGKLYDANAVQELVNRRQVQETMANMGLTDSGLNRTQQTAIALQRGNADAQVRLSQQQKTQELQDRIDQLLGNSAAQKIQQEADIRSATEKWYSSTLENLRSSAAQQGTSAYNAQMQAQAAEAKAREQAAAQAAAQANLALAQARMRQSGTFDPIDRTIDYSLWTNGDWMTYFNDVRVNYGPEAALSDLNAFAKADLIPKEYMMSAQIAARGKFGH